MAKSDKINLPALNDVDSETIVDQITSSLGFPRNVLASNEEIELVWHPLKKELNSIRLEYRHELLARMVVAIRVGLFSSAVNEMWNTAIIVIRQKIKDFGLEEANQFLAFNLDDRKFKELKDKEVLDIAVELGLLGEDSYFFLNHCREIRNNYSSAHPSNSTLDGTELNYFIHQCVKHVLSNEVKYYGFRSDEFLNSIKGSKLDDDGIDTLSEKIKNTNELQKLAILKALFGIYVNEKNEEFVRQNCLNVSRKNWGYFSERAKSEILVMYSDYLVQDDTKKQYARLFFERVGAIEILPKDQQVSIVRKIIKQLEDAHNGFDNFYNEVPFAERLVNFLKKIPEQIIKEYVYVVSLCFVGNAYGTSRQAEPFYKQMIENFTVREIDKLFELTNEDNYLSHSLKHYYRCKIKFKQLLQLLNSESIPTKWKASYNKLVK